MNIHETLDQFQHQSRTIGTNSLNSSLDPIHRDKQKQNANEFDATSSSSQRIHGEFSSLNRCACNSNASTPPKVARYKRDRRAWIREEEEEAKNFTGFEPEKRRRNDTGSFTKFEAKNSRSEAKSKGTAKKRFESPIKTQVTSKLYFIPLEIITNSEWGESVEDRNCSARNPNFNTKWFEKKQENTSRSTTCVNRSEPLGFLRKFHSEKTRKAKQFKLPDWNSRFVLIQRLKTISFDWFMLRMKARVD